MNAVTRQEKEEVTKSGGRCRILREYGRADEFANGGKSQLLSEQKHRHLG